ncbi:hypothetical protein GCM10027062_25090 [Nocardioides hungaricus]
MCITGPYDSIPLEAGGHCDLEAELVAVVGNRADRVHERKAWDHAAGLTVGQDMSERRAQGAGPMPQFSMAKFHRRQHARARPSDTRARPASDSARRGHTELQWHRLDRAAHDTED